MARFVFVEALGRVGLTAINPEQITYINDVNQDRAECVVHFGHDRAVTVKMTTQNFVILIQTEGL